MSSLRLLPVAVRRVLARRPWIHWLVVCAAASVTAATVHEHVERIDDARREWGETRRVLVAARDLAPGDPLLTVARELPVAVIPEGAMSAGNSDERDELDGRVSRQHVSAGEIVTDVDIGRAGVTGLLALVPAGWVAVPIVESPSAGAEVGAPVRVVSEGVLLAPDALVVGYHDDVTMVAAPADIAPMLPVAAEAGGLALLLVP